MRTSISGSLPVMTMPVEVAVGSLSHRSRVVFLAAGDFVYNEVNFAAKRLSSARARLAAFQEQVKAAKKKGAGRKFPQYILEYADAATRASTDLSRRELRIETLKKVILGELNPK